jgi:hypothetical protein
MAEHTSLESVDQPGRAFHLISPHPFTGCLGTDPKRRSHCGLPLTPVAHAAHQLGRLCGVRRAFLWMSIRSPDRAKA